MKYYIFLVAGCFSVGMYAMDDQGDGWNDQCQYNSAFFNYALLESKIKDNDPDSLSALGRYFKTHMWNDQFGQALIVRAENVKNEYAKNLLLNIKNGRDGRNLALNNQETEDGDLS